MSKYLSRKIKFISLFAMLAVVFIHSYNFKDTFLTPTTSISEGFNGFAMFEYFFSNCLLRFAVPLFFVISGYLFFRNYTSVKESYGKKLKSRARSLVVPYCLWAFISALFMFLLSFSDVAARTAIVQESVPNGALSLLTCFIDPPAFQLWYIQQLIIFTIISPLFYVLIKKTKGLILILFAVPWLLDLSFVINSQALFFFSIGAYIGIFGKERNFVKKDNRAVTAVISLGWICLSILITVLAAMDIENTAITFVRLLLYKLNEVIGLVAVWVLYDHIFKRITNKKLMVLMSNYVFFIYAMHEPLLHLAYQLGLLSKNSAIGHIVMYMFLPISIIAVCIIAGMGTKKLSKTFYSLLTGGRNINTKTLKKAVH